MLFDIRHVPFSRFGRFLTLSVMEGALYLRSVRGGDLRPGLGRLCRISFLDAAGSLSEPDFSLTPDRLLAQTPTGRVEFVIGEGERLHMRGHGLIVAFELESSRYDYAYLTPHGDHCLVVAYENTRIVPRVTKGKMKVQGNWNRDRAENLSCTFSGSDGFEATIDLFSAVPPAPTKQDFDSAHADAISEFREWLAKSPEGGAPQARMLAAYLLWANTVPAEGALTRPAVYMSKNAMINIWSWDNAFSALGVAAMNACLAFDQFGAIFDHQHPSGLLPDFVNDRDISFAFTKPPVHGWAVMRLMERHPKFITPARRDDLYIWLDRQIGYWLTYARKNDQNLPAYFHGNDSGWDNASFFAEGGPVIAPDLPTFLILACDCLAKLSHGHSTKVSHWVDQGDKLLALLLDQLWDGRTFGTRILSAPDTLRTGQSLIQFTPLLLGQRLPKDVSAKLLAHLQTGGWLTSWGPATESPQSPLYEPDGYWRGPIWAPTTMLLWDGLCQQGEYALANEIARQFLHLCETSGMAENFDALQGTGLRDRAFAWTSAVYLWLASSLEDKNTIKGAGL